MIIFYYISLAVLFVSKTYIKILLFYLLNITNFLRRTLNYTIFLTIFISVIYLVLVKFIIIIYYLLNNYIISLLLV